MSEFFTRRGVRHETGPEMRIPMAQDGTDVVRGVLSAGCCGGL
ncbi:MAG: hypothetical protein AAYR33_08005 [Acetobacteraceae bacterium]